MDVLVDMIASSSLDDKGVSWCQQRRALVIANRTITFTRTEQRLLAPLGSAEPVTYADLAGQAYGCQLDTKVRVMMDKHIDRIRGKLRGLGVYIYCILGYGYVILPEIETLPREGSVPMSIGRHERGRL